MPDRDAPKSEALLRRIREEGGYETVITLCELADGPAGLVPEPFVLVDALLQEPAEVREAVLRMAVPR